MDFIIGLPRSRRLHVTIWVIANFLFVMTIHLVEDYVRLYIHDMVRLHGVPVSIISCTGEQFTMQFLKYFQKCLGSKVN